MAFLGFFHSTSWTQGQLFAGQSDYFAFYARAADMTVAIVLTPDPSDARTDLDMYVWSLASPSSLVFPTMQNPLHFGNAQEAAFVTAPTWSEGYYLAQVFPASTSKSGANLYSVVAVPNYTGDMNPWYSISQIAVISGISLISLICATSMCVLWIRRTTWLREQEAAQAAAAGRNGRRAPPESASAEQIQALPVSEWSDGMFATEDAVCAICLGEYGVGEDGVGEAVKTLPCAHHFHAACLDRWLAQAKHCPLCNQNLETAVSVRSPTVATLERAGSSGGGGGGDGGSTAIELPGVFPGIVAVPSVALRPLAVAPSFAARGNAGDDEFKAHDRDADAFLNFRDT